MLIAYYIVAGVLALANLAAGGLKLVRSREQLLAQGMKWVEAVPTWTPRVVGAFEVLGAIGLIVPIATGIAPVLSPIAAIGIAVIQLGAIVVHLRIGEKPIPNVVIVLLAAAAAVLGFLSL